MATPFLALATLFEKNPQSLRVAMAGTRFAQGPPP